MVSGSEMKALKTVGKENGHTTTRLVSQKLGIDTSYAAVLCLNLTQGRYLDQENRGRFRITRKGREALGWREENDVHKMEPLVSFKPVQREEFHWRSLRAVGTSHCQAANGFSQIRTGRGGLEYRALWSARRLGKERQKRFASPF